MIRATAQSDVTGEQMDILLASYLHVDFKRQLQIVHRYSIDSCLCFGSSEVLFPRAISVRLERSDQRKSMLAGE